MSVNTSHGAPIGTVSASFRPDNKAYRKHLHVETAESDTEEDAKHDDHNGEHNKALGHTQAVAMFPETPTSRRLSSFFSNDKDKLSPKERHGRDIVEQNLGPDGILLWNAMERCVLDYYGIGKMHTIRTNVFTLALKASELAKPTLMKVIKGDTARNLREHGRRVEKPFMDALYLAHSSARAGNTMASSVDVIPLAEALHYLHNVLFEILRSCIKDEMKKPNYSLKLSNTFIDIGNGEFLHAVMNAPRYKEERKMVSGATASLLQSLGHPEFIMARTHRENKCHKTGCNRIVTYDRLCAIHALKKVRQRFYHPNLSEFLRENNMLSAFYQYAHSHGNNELKAQISFVLAVEDYCKIRNARLRLRRARIIFEKYLSPKSSWFVGESISAQGQAEIEAVEAAIEACEQGFENPNQVLQLRRAVLHSGSQVVSGPRIHYANICTSVSHRQLRDTTGSEEFKENVLLSGSSSKGSPSLYRSRSSSGPPNKERGTLRGAWSFNSWNHIVENASTLLPSTLFDVIKESVMESIEVVFRCKFVTSKEFSELLRQVCTELVTPAGPGSKGIQKVTKVNPDELLKDDGDQDSESKE